MSKDPPPPQVGEKFWGPPLSDRFERSTYEVRAIVDFDPEKYPFHYQIVFRYWSPRRQWWRYLIEGSFSLDAGIYRAKRKRQNKLTES